MDSVERPRVELSDALSYPASPESTHLIRRLEVRRLEVRRLEVRRDHEEENRLRF